MKRKDIDLILIAGDFGGGSFQRECREYESKIVGKYGVIAKFWPKKVIKEYRKKEKRWQKLSARNTKKIFNVLKKIKKQVYYVHGNWDSISNKKHTFENSGDFLIDKVRGKNKVTKLNLLKFGPFTLDTAETTLKTLYYNFDIKKDKFIFWYTSLATILQTSFAYLVTDGKYELDPKKILDNMKKYGFKYFNFELVLKNIENQEVKDVEELYELACNFIDKLAEKVISEIKS